MSPLPTLRGHCSPDRPFLSCEAGRERDVASSSPFLSLCPGRSNPEAGRTRSAPRSGVQPRPQRLVPFSGARSRPLPLAAHPFPFLPLLLRFLLHPTPPPSLGELAGHPLAVHLVPLCAFPLPLPRGGSSGERTGTSTSVACVYPARGALRKALAGDLHRSRGWEHFDQSHSVHSGPRLSALLYT